MSVAKTRVDVQHVEDQGLDAFLDAALGAVDDDYDFSSMLGIV